MKLTPSQRRTIIESNRIDESRIRIDLNGREFIREVSGEDEEKIYLEDLLVLEDTPDEDLKSSIEK